MDLILVPMIIGFAIPVACAFGGAIQIVQKFFRGQSV